jgi:hypothetical protein
MSNVSKLKTRKGEGPPPPQDAPGNTGKAPRDKIEAKVSVDFSVPESVAEDFGQEAGRVFGFKKGAKSKLFLKLWEDYLAGTTR